VERVGGADMPITRAFVIDRCWGNVDVLGHRLEIGLLKIEHPVSVAESAHNLAFNVPEIALLSRIGTG
jgi:hypothetical protein